jgi:hypothetical protein
MAPIFNVKPICGTVREEVHSPVNDRKVRVELADQTLSIISEVLDSLEVDKAQNCPNKQRKANLAFTFASKWQPRVQVVLWAVATIALISAAFALRIHDLSR